VARSASSRSNEVTNTRRKEHSPFARVKKPRLSCRHITFSTRLQTCDPAISPARRASSCSAACSSSPLLCATCRLFERRHARLDVLNLNCLGRVIHNAVWRSQLGGCRRIRVEYSSSIPGAANPWPLCAVRRRAPARPPGPAAARPACHTRAAGVPVKLNCRRARTGPGL
jgi:hypothetical protein